MKYYLWEIEYHIFNLDLIRKSTFYARNYEEVFKALKYYIDNHYYKGNLDTGYDEVRYKVKKIKLKKDLSIK